MRIAATIELPYEVPSQNARDGQHWSARHRERKELTWRVRAALPPGGCPHGTRKRAVVIHAFRRRRITDRANLVGGAKALVDALVAAGVLVDDSDRWAAITYDQGLHMRAGYAVPTTVVSIYEIDEGT